MRYMDLGVTHIRYMDICGYIHNYEGFNEKFTYKPYENFLFSSLFFSFSLGEDL